MLKPKNILIFLALAIIIGGLAFVVFNNKQTTVTQQKAAQPKTQPSPQEDNKPRIISTKPDPLEEAIISATQVIEITFNKPLENVGEFKNKIEPKVDYKVELSADRKTAKITPTKAFELGSTYTLFIGTESKFDGIGRWGEEKIFHFKTIKYTGV